MTTNTVQTPILLVDDVTANLTALTAILAAPNVKVLTARSGIEALEILIKQDVAVALVDVQMPEMDGFELAELMRGRADTKQVPIIFLTAGEHNQARIFRGYESGAVDFLYKPIDARLLQSKVAVFVELYEHRTQLSGQVAKLHEMIGISDHFISVLGHDLRNPSNAISLATELLISEESDPQKVDMLKRIHRSNLRMNRLVAQLLDFARARLGGGMPVRPVPLDLGEVARAAIKELTVTGAQVRVEERGNLRGSLDPDRMGQVMSNLLGNALIHGTKGSPISVQLDGIQAERLIIRVHNQGKIAEELMGRLFTPGPSAHRSASGLGLGLYIVDQIVRAHGGTITCTSDTGGTIFAVELPRNAAV